MKSIFDEFRNDHYARYAVRLRFPPGNRLVGGVPREREMVQRWIHNKLAGPEEELRQRVAAALEARGLTPESVTASDVAAIAEELAIEHGGIVHTRDAEGRLFIFHGKIKAMLKEAVNTAFPLLAGARLGLGKQQKSPQSFFGEAVHVWPHRVYICREQPDGTLRILTEADAQTDVIVGTVQTPQGPRSVVTQYEYVDDCVLDFEVHVRMDAVPASWWPHIWIAAEDNGLGAKRTPGFGRFIVEQFERLTEPAYIEQLVGDAKAKRTEESTENEAPARRGRAKKKALDAVEPGR